MERIDLPRVGQYDVTVIDFLLSVRQRNCLVGKNDVLAQICLNCVTQFIFCLRKINEITRGWQTDSLVINYSEITRGWPIDSLVINYSEITRGWPSDSLVINYSEITRDWPTESLL